MAEERIDIQVTDKGADKAAKNLRTIATAAKTSADHVDRLKAALAGLPANQLATLGGASRAVTDDLRAISASVKTLQSDLSSLAADAGKASSALNTVGSASQNAAKGAKATSSAMTATSGASRTYASSMHNVANSTGLAGHQMGNLVAQLNDIGVSLAGGQNPLLVLIQQGSQIQYLASTVEGGFKTLLKASLALVVGQQQVTNAATATAAANVAQATSAANAATAMAAETGAAANLVIAEQALVVAKAEATAATTAATLAETELALAQARVTATANTCFGATQRLNAAKAASVTASQAATVANAELAAAQAAQARASLAVAQAQQRAALATAGTALGLGTVGAILVGLAPVVGTVAAKFTQWHSDLNKDSGLKEYIGTLGLTKKELKELENQTITYGDMAMGVWMTIKEGLAGLEPVFSAIGDAIMWVVDLIWNTLKNFSFALTALFKGTYKAVVTIWNQLPAAFADLFAQAANKAIGALEWIANKAVEVLNYLGGSFESVTLRRMENANAGAASRMGQDIADGYINGFREAEAGYNAFVRRAGENANRAARDRLGRDAAAIIEDRGEGRAGRKPKVDRTAENRAHALAQVNLQLDNELARMKMLNQERAVEQRMDQITEALAQKRIQMTTTEAAAIRAKVVEIERFKYVQAEMDRMTEDALGPLRTLNAAREAANILLQRGTIDQERFNREMARANRAYAEATDPLFAMNEQLESAQRLTGLYGDALEQANYLEQIRQALVAQGYEGDALRQKMLSQEVQDLIQRNNLLRDQMFIQSQVAGVVDPLLEEQRMIDNKVAIYAELERLRQEDLLSEESYQRAKLELDMKYSQQRLQSQSDFFGALASLTSKGHGAIGAISKAAAVAQATIDGYVAVQKALASAPPPWNMIAAAAVAMKTGAQVAGIMSTNVGSYATGGQFVVGGRSGVDANNINMNVTRGERVTIETVRQQRANDNQAQGAGGAQEPPVVNLKSVNVIDPRMALDALDTAEGNQVFINRIEANASQIRAVLGVG